MRNVCLCVLLFSAGSVVAFAQDGGSTNVEESAAAVDALKTFLAKSNDLEATAKQPFAGVSLTADDSRVARRLLWQSHTARIKAERAEEMKARVVKLGELSMPFHMLKFGEKPEDGRSLYISMHGGGGAPKRVNDQQWENQKRLYRLEEGIYLSPRAPTDTWNLWHQAHIDQFFSRLIENLIVLEEVNPDRVYILGYSAGGDGVYQLAPRMADRLAAAAMMAGHPNETSPLGLRNIGFTIHVGGRDAGYNRNKIAEGWREKLAALQKDDPKGYKHWVKIYPQKGHWMDREDASALPWLAKFVRNPLPEKIVWKQDDVTHSRFYWLAVDAKNEKARTELVASRSGQTIELVGEDFDAVTIRLNDEMIDFDQPITVTANKRTVFEGRPQRTIGVLAETLAERGDPQLVFSSELTVRFP